MQLDGGYTPFRGYPLALQRCTRLAEMELHTGFKGIFY